MGLFGTSGSLVGLDVGDVYACASEIQLDPQGRPVSVRGGWAAMDPDAPPHVAGKVIGDLWKNARLGSSTVASCMRSKSLVMRHFRFPPMDENELRSSLTLESESALQMSSEEIAFQWHVHRRPSAEGGAVPREVEGVLVAVPQKEIDRHVAIIEAAGLYPAIVDVGCLAIANLYLQLTPGFDSTGTAVCIVNLYAHSADMVILFDGRCVYPRTVFAYSTSWEDGVDHLIDSLRDMFRYQQFKLREAPVSSVLLTGLVPGCDGFVDRIGKSLGVPVRLWSPASDVKAVAIGPSSGVEKYTSTASMMSCAMGLALRRET